VVAVEGIVSMDTESRTEILLLLQVSKLGM